MTQLYTNIEYDLCGIMVPYGIMSDDNKPLPETMLNYRE